MKKTGGKKGIYLLGASSLFNDVGSEMIAPILPFYLTSLGGTGLALGLLSGLREGLASIFKLLGGWYSDRLGKRMPFVTLGYSISILSRFLLTLTTIWQMVVAFVSIERFGKIRDAPRDVIVSKFTKKHGWGFGIHQMLDSLGAVLGSIIVLILIWKLNLGLRTIIFIAAIISALSIIPLFFVKEIHTKPRKVPFFSNIASLKSKLKYVIFVISLFSVANFGLYMFMLLKAKEIIGTTAGAIALGVLFNIAWTSLSTYFGSLSDRIGRKKIILSGYFLFFVVLLGFVYASSILFLAILFILYGIVYATTQSNQKALISDLSEKNKGTIFGIYHFCIGISSIVGGTIAGIIWDISPTTMFVYLSVISVIAFILLFLFKE